MKKFRSVNDLTEGEMENALTRLLNALYVDWDTGTLDRDREIDSCDFVSKVSDILEDLGVVPPHKDNGKVPPWIVAWEVKGKRYCLECCPKMPEPTGRETVYIIWKGRKWSENSAPVCAKCGRKMPVSPKRNHKR